MRVVCVIIILFITSLFADFPGFGLQATWMPPIPEGPMNGSYIGRSMSILGDINGDGFDDLAISAEIAGDTATGKIPGKVYIYLGRAGAPLSLSELPDIIFQGVEHRYWFGYNVSGGDFNGDDTSDIMMVAYGLDTLQGKLLVYLGGDQINETPDLIFTTTPSEKFWFQGTIAAFVGDINGDGYDDIATAMSSRMDGYVLLFNGGAVPDLVPDDTLLKDEGYLPCLGYGGDINGDGIDDILVGEPHYSAEDTGKVSIFLGGNPFSLVPDTVIFGRYISHFFGHNLAIIGDINADGFDDFGIAGALEGTSNLYGCHVYYGSDDGIYEEVAHLYDITQDDYGNALLGAGDINFDGYDDFIAGAPGKIGGWDNAPGHVHVYYGDSLPPDTTDVFQKQHRGILLRQSSCPFRQDAADE